ncbi:hypothetical protein GALMADRAFT_254532 [Galerina marginata CBS 339.88]|uniref:Uncharacterized protein n=1 Tax=Galerina marginata (strain CBS 339.88) TaxID=685588 RepID=A0A067SLR5_GALM3|nr:hypothetical protein GALMADRAFT_254532 [Galerina marginata CBS 339.88]
MALARPRSLHDANQPAAIRISVDSAEDSTWENLLDTRDKEQQVLVNISPPPSSRFDWTSASKIVLVLVLAISYLSFCCIAHYHAIPVGGSGFLGPRFVHFTTGAGITTITISIIYIALWPIHGLIAEIRSEEFFRLLSIHPNGVPFDSVNAVSAPTTGVFDIFWATVRSRCSSHLTATLAITLLIAATSTLAPAALNTVSVLVDVDDPAYQVGAILNLSLIQKTGSGFRSFPPSGDLYLLASSMSWVENVLNITTAYSRVASGEDDSFGYIVPFPPGYTTATQAYWTTDIIVLNPSCSWQNATSTGAVDANFNSTADEDWTAALPEANLSLRFANDPFVAPNTNTKGSLAFNGNTSFNVDFSPAIFVISVLDQPMVLSGTPFPSSTNFSNIPTLHLSNGNILAFLVCNPRASIQTRQVRSTGDGTLTLGKHQPSQGNLDLVQVNFLLGGVLSQLATSSGPFTSEVGMADMMIRLIFGDNFQPFSNMPPAPLTNITAVYKQVIQSAMKTFLSGAVNTTNVPGGSIQEQLVFTSSLGHVIASAVLFALLAMTLVVAQFREKRDAFILDNVAAALADSNAPQMFVEKQRLAGAGERKILRLVRSDKGGLNCTYQSVD